MEMFEERQNQPKNAEKRIKYQEITEKGDEDGISALPDGLLLEILSRLPYTKDAIRTGKLSKRWENLWNWVPTLIFTHLDHHRRCECFQNPNSIYDFARLVEKTLTQCRQLKLKKFKLHSYYAIRFESQFNNWIRHAISCNVEELDLEFLYRDRDAEFRLDQSIFNNSCFTDLKLAGCMLNPSGAISWKNLKSLYISYLMLDEDLIENILSGSPLLETLVLEDFDGYRGIEISSYDESEDDIIKINAPQLKKLKKFEAASSEFDIKLELQLNSWICYVIRCNVKEIILKLSTNKFESESDFKLDQTLFTCSCLTDLTLDLCTCMVIPAGVISWKNLRNLCISYGSLDEELIENILSGSPVLETLELDLCYGYRRLNITSKSLKNLVISKYWNYLNSYDVSTSDADLDGYLDYCIGSEAHIDMKSMLLIFNH
ncbi:F-box protein At5g03100 [Lactuca sativa]|uniref:F-box protein At5g03100 n=1 Tax=Lactuca sativa TaxID=4236 RepID=UPI000CACAED9|nr:F-box protein At5g03100 [Lactuca sativa]